MIQARQGKPEGASDAESLGLQLQDDRESALQVAHMPIRASEAQPGNLHLHLHLNIDYSDTKQS